MNKEKIVLMAILLPALFLCMGLSGQESPQKYRKAAEQGDAVAQRMLGNCYRDGTGIVKDENEAVKWYRKAAAQGDAEAQNSLGVRYFRGAGVAKDEAEAVKWYRKAAQQGFSKAQYNLGSCYKDGIGVAKNYAEAVKWYQLSAAQGHDWAQYALGICYDNGWGVVKNYIEAVKWYRKAAEQGNAEAQNNLGDCCLKGEGIAKDYAEAVKWFRKAAEKGSALGQSNLGKCYYNGTGVAKDSAEAMKWYRKAAEKGNVNAKNMLAKISDSGNAAVKKEPKVVKLSPKAAEQATVNAKNMPGNVNDSGNAPAGEDAIASDFAKARPAGTLSAEMREQILGPQPPSGAAAAVPPEIMEQERAALKAVLDKDTPENRALLARVRHDHAFAILADPKKELTQERLEEAVAYAKSATMLEQNNASHWFLTGHLFRELAQWDNRAIVMAEQALRHAVEVDPEHAASWMELGLMMADQQRGYETMIALEKALERDPAITAPDATGLLCAVYALNDEGFRGIDFFQGLYAGNPEVPALGIGCAIMLHHLGDCTAAISQAQDIMLIEEASTPEYLYAAKLVNEWKGEKP